MQTVFDWVTIAIFLALVVLFLQRSTADKPKDKMYQYVPPALGCAIANYLGNHDERYIAIVIVIAVVGYIIFVLKPQGNR